MVEKYRDTLCMFVVMSVKEIDSNSTNSIKNQDFVKGQFMVHGMHSVLNIM